MKKYFILFILINIIINIDAQQINDKVIIYSKFLKSGKLSWIISAFNNPLKWEIDTNNNINNSVKFDIIQLKNLINCNKKIRLFNKKYGEIKYAGEFILDNKNYFFFFTLYHNEIIVFEKEFITNKKLKGFKFILDSHCLVLI